jgi:cyclophilin family peptidyl-prolyl cis-trans isomerase
MVKWRSMRCSPAMGAGVQLSLIFSLLLSSFLHAQEAYSPGPQQGYPPGLYAELTTPKGLIVISLALGRAPMTVANFVGLAEGTIRNQAFPEGIPFYDGSAFRRVAPGHVIQGGRPASEVASTPGYSIPNEIHPTLGHGKEGMVGLANGGPHTGKAEFYITLGDRSYLDGDYTVFGEVYEGMDVVREIVRGDSIETVRIVRVGAEAGAFRPTTESSRQMRREVRTRVLAEEEAQQTEDLAFLEASWPHATKTESGWSYVVLREGRGTALAPGDTAMVRYTGRTVRGMAFASIAESGDPNYVWPGTESGGCFPFPVGEEVVNSGFDEAVSGMARGEKRLVIVPAEKAYDPVGFYGVEKAGVPRFVIRPRSILIYEVEVLAR